MRVRAIESSAIGSAVSRCCLVQVRPPSLEVVWKTSMPAQVAYVRAIVGDRVEDEREPAVHRRVGGDSGKEVVDARAACRHGLRRGPIDAVDGSGHDDAAGGARACSGAALPDHVHASGGIDLRPRRGRTSAWPGCPPWRGKPRARAPRRWRRRPSIASPGSRSVHRSAGRRTPCRRRRDCRSAGRSAARR